jgi:hypothetical protein
MKQTNDPPEAKMLRPYRLLGVGGILAQSNVVAKAFGRPLGFILMVLALVVSTVVSTGLVLLVAKFLGL